MNINSHTGRMPQAAAPIGVTGRSLIALAVGSRKRSAALPDVPTTAEAGYPGVVSISWYGVIAPAGIPNDILNRLNAELVRIADVTEGDLDRQLKTAVAMAEPLMLFVIAAFMSAIPI